ncbi:IclR family transcriptional regulator [Maritalea myrionectae]|uniref:IclR family transcriptional regulator n=1 Tax=Maritalea myrionectae TaxID=454601 RepID=UPI0004164DAF|nr:IclR family transcriptional regulator [Maritalea myrionectae]
MIEEPEVSSKGGIQVISRAAKIMRVIGNSNDGLSLGKIADQVSLPRSTVQRITSALLSEGLLINDAQGRGLKIGPGITALAGAAHYDVVEHCRLLLTELTQKTGETTDLSAFRGVGMTFLDQVPGTHRLITVSKVGEVFPLTTTANGKSCLAKMERDKAMDLAGHEWERNGISGDADQFNSMLDAIAESGIAFDIDEHTPGISAAGFSFRDWSGDLHAISMPVPSNRFVKHRREIEKALRETSKSVQQMFK